MAAVPKAKFCFGGRFFENTVTSTVDLASIRYVTLHGNVRSCLAQVGMERALRAVSVNCYVRTRPIHVAHDVHTRRRDGVGIPKTRSSAKKAPPRHGTPQGKMIAEKSSRGNRTWPTKAAEKTTFRACANYASRTIIMQMKRRKHRRKIGNARGCFAEGIVLGLAHKIYSARDK